MISSYFYPEHQPVHSETKAALESESAVSDTDRRMFIPTK